MDLPSDILCAVLPWSIIECVPLTLATIIYEVEIVHFLFFNGKTRPTSPRDSLDAVSFLPWPVPETPRSWQGVLAAWICRVIWFFSEFTLDFVLILVSSDEDLRIMKAERLKRDKARSRGSPKKRPFRNHGQEVSKKDSQSSSHEREHSGSRDQVQVDAQQHRVEDSCQNAPVIVQVVAKDDTISIQDMKALNAETRYKESCVLLDHSPEATAARHPATPPAKEDPDSLLTSHINHSESVSELIAPGSKAEVGSRPTTMDGPSCESAADTIDTTSESEVAYAIDRRARSPRGRAKARKSPEPRPRLMVPLLKAVQLVQSPPGAAEQHPFGYCSSGDQKALSPTTRESSETSSNNGEHSETTGANKAKRRNKKKNKSKKRSKSSSSMTTNSSDACSNLKESCSVSTSAASHSQDGQPHGEQEMVAAMENGDVELSFAAFVSTLGHSQFKKACSTAEDPNGCSQ